MPPRCWALHAADLAGLWEECPRCFYLSVVRAFPRPPGPGAVTAIDARLKSACEGRRTESLAPGMPVGVFEIAERWLESRPLDVHLPDAVRQCIVRGTLDTLVRLDDGGWGVVEVRSAARASEPLASSRAGWWATPGPSSIPRRARSESGPSPGSASSSSSPRSSPGMRDWVHSPAA
jgi:hypothetical protein